MANIESVPQFKSPDSPDKNKDRISAIETEVFDLLVPGYRAGALQPEDFEGKYTREEITRDLMAVKNKKSRFSKENSERHKRADILEAILAEQVELSDWFGTNALTIAASEYDDFFHGVDMAVEFEKEAELKYLALGIDITSSAQKIEEKLAKIKESIRTGKLTQMKYFSSDRNPSPELPLKPLPNVIMGIDVRTINELATLWLEIFKAKEMKNKTKDPETQNLYAAEIKAAKDKLAHHRVQMLILGELEKQLEVFANFANDIGHKDVAVRYLELLKLVREILETKHISRDDDKINAQDDVYRSIENGLNKFDSL